MFLISGRSGVGRFQRYFAAWHRSPPPGAQRGEIEASSCDQQDSDVGRNLGHIGDSSVLRSVRVLVTQLHAEGFATKVATGFGISPETTCASVTPSRIARSEARKAIQTSCSAAADPT
jgi:hypothetical protein